MAVILLFLPIYAVLWLHSRWTQPAHIHRSAAARRARHRHAGIIGLCLMFGVPALFYGSLLVGMALPRPHALPAAAQHQGESLAEYADRRAAEMTLDDLRYRFRTQALP